MDINIGRIDSLFDFQAFVNVEVGSGFRWFRDGGCYTLLLVPFRSEEEKSRSESQASSVMALFANAFRPVITNYKHYEPIRCGSSSRGKKPSTVSVDDDEFPSFRRAMSDSISRPCTERNRWGHFSGPRMRNPKRFHSCPIETVTAKQAMIAKATTALENMGKFLLVVTMVLVVAGLWESAHAQLCLLPGEAGHIACINWCKLTRDCNTGYCLNGECHCILCEHGGK
ncbi:unnamed protein product [Darwinula stevensoni]|uniref:Uncharacterized protein n=1 Tax=Darwinula stevensoni TaxID=69355 RepID=A0A7R9A9K4_9CRUS|nr:unnamed protein product [Darwinula stevensoni]CAG0897516.1 unnamed protein product [Darwinula stevensoni]